MYDWEKYRHWAYTIDTQATRHVICSIAHISTRIHGVKHLLLSNISIVWLQVMSYQTVSRRVETHVEDMSM